jgi:hypothetical protein
VREAKGRVGGEDHRQTSSLREIFESVAVGLLLLAAAGSAISGSGLTLFATVLAAWVVLPFVVGLRNTLDAGCAFMLITIGMLLAVELARHGPGYLIP